MIKKFKILDTNLENIEDTHFICETEIGKDSIILDKEEPFRTFMFNGLQVTLKREDKFIHGEVHG